MGLGGGGGGGASGRTDFPDYMKGYHRKLLGVESDGSIVGSGFAVSLIDAFNEASTGHSPYFSYTSNQLQANTLFFPAGKSVADAAYQKPFDLLAALNNFDFDTKFSTNRSNQADPAWVADLIESQTTVIDNELSVITPKFHARMRDIGAVMGSAFVIGDALNQRSKLVALATSRLEVERLAIQKEELALRVTQHQVEFKKLLAIVTTDMMKIYHAVKAETDDTNAEWVAKDLMWDLKLFQYASAPLASISGAALQVEPAKGSKFQAAISGGFSGAAAGASASGGNPWAALAGGVAGVAGALIR